MICFQDVDLRIGSKLLVRNLNWTIYPKQKVGLIGANGSGKTSLFALLRGQMDTDKGSLDISSNLALAYVEQETRSSELNAIDFVLTGDKELCELEKQLAMAEQADDGIKIAKLHEKLDHIDGYSARARAAQLLDGLGFFIDQHDMPVKAFSGGWRMRLNLAKALMCRSDVLLLDEPTNHLDLDAVLWLEQWIQKYKGTLLLISHDRDFLDRTVEHIAYLNGQQIKTYTGNYSQFEKQRAMDLQLQQAAFDKQQKQIAHIQSYVDRFRYKASKAKQAQSRIKAIERLELVTAVDPDLSFSFEFKPINKCPDPLISLENLSLGYDDVEVIKQINLSIRPKDRLAILGPNGAGKSTLIKALAGDLAPMQGERHVSPNTKIAYFAQHQVDKLHLDESPFYHLRNIAPDVTEQELRNFLGSFAFSGARIDQKVSHFSGGEKSRLALALIVWQQPNLLLLDEPTNHLDLDMRQALSVALQSFQGALLLVSHDRFLLNVNADNLRLLSDKQLKQFDGDLDDYEKWLLEHKRLANRSQDVSGSNSKKAERQQKAQDRKSRQPFEAALKQIEQQLTKANQVLEKAQASLADNSIYEDENKGKLQSLLIEQAEAKSMIEKLEQDWLAADEKLNSL